MRATKELQEQIKLEKAKREQHELADMFRNARSIMSQDEAIAFVAEFYQRKQTSGQQPGQPSLHRTLSFTSTSSTPSSSPSTSSPFTQQQQKPPHQMFVHPSVHRTNVVWANAA